MSFYSNIGSNFQQLRNLILAAIDIGSNAARLLISEVTKKTDGTPAFNQLNLVRVPLRLGFDVFETREISPSKVKMLLHTMHAFKQLCNAYDVQNMKACATSAMRDASNAPGIIEQVKMETGIEIEVISGETEASLIYDNYLNEQLSASDAFLYIDVGGGSTELSFFNRRQLQFRKSFDIGTIRLFKQQVADHLWREMHNYLKLNTRNYPKVYAIGSGGNINKLFSMARIKEGQPMNLALIGTYYQQLGKLSLEERMNRYKLKADRADVIVPALLIYLNVMQWAGANEIFVPRIGLADGLIQHLYKQISHNYL